MKEFLTSIGKTSVIWFVNAVGGVPKDNLNYYGIGLFWFILFIVSISLLMFLGIMYFKNKNK